MSPSQASSTQARDLEVEYRLPVVADGKRIWEIAKDSQVLDVNSSYAYVLWCHEFAQTSIVAEFQGRVVGFVTGYRRPLHPSAVMVWQVAVDDEMRGRRVAGSMLHRLLDRLAPEGVDSMHTTISPDNVASQRLFESVAHARGWQIGREDFFAADAFPDSHEPEDLYRLGPDSTQ